MAPNRRHIRARAAAAAWSSSNSSVAAARRARLPPSRSGSIPHDQHRHVTSYQWSVLSSIPDRPRPPLLEYPIRAATRVPISVVQSRWTRPKPASHSRQCPQPACSIALSHVQRIIGGPQIPIAYAVLQNPPLPAVSSFGGFRTPAAGVRPLSVRGRHQKTFTQPDMPLARCAGRSHYL
jgi:hypothetical protein